MLACPDPEHCRGHRTPEPVRAWAELTPGRHRVSWAELPCPVARELHRLRDAPVDARALQVVVSADMTRLTPNELADLTRISARAAVWTQQRRDDLAVALSDHAAPIRLHGDDGPVLVAEPGAGEVGVALHLSPGTAKALLRRTRKRRDRAPSLVEALRQGDSSHAHAWEVDQACTDLDDAAAAEVAGSCGPVLLHGTKQEAAKAVAKAVTRWHLANPEPDEPDDDGPDPGPEPPPPKGPRDKRCVESFASQHPGMAFVLALLPTEDAAALMARLEEAARLVKATGDPRSREQIEADTLAEFAWGGLPREDLLDILRTYDAQAAAEADAASATAADSTAGEPAADEPVTGEPVNGEGNVDDLATEVHADHGAEAEGVATADQEVADTAETGDGGGEPGAEGPEPADPYEGFWGPDGDPGPDTGPPGAAAPQPQQPPAAPAPPPTPRDPETGLTAGQLALLTALSGQVRAQVHATVSLQTLLGIREALAEIGTSGPGHRGTDLGPVPPEVARALAARFDSLWDRYVHDENGVLHGISPSYAVPDTLRRTVLAEYATCTFYGCPRPAAGCDQDHINDWADGGTTEHPNLHPPCRPHHNLKTHGGWTVTRDQRGQITWTSPHGQTVTTDPADYRPRDKHYGWT